MKPVEIVLAESPEQLYEMEKLCFGSKTRASRKELENRFKFCESYVAEVDGKPVGFLIATPQKFRDDVAFLSNAVHQVECEPLAESYFIVDICVLPDFRNKGVGKSLMSYAIDIASEAEFNNFYLLAVNPNSFAFFEKLGFKQSANLGGRRAVYSKRVGVVE